MRTTVTLPLLVAISLLIGGCTAATRPIACGALRDGAFAVASYGCMKITEPVAREACTKAGLAASLVAFQACVKEAGAATAATETGDPADPAAHALEQDARAIIQEYAALDSQPDELRRFLDTTGPRQ